MMLVDANILIYAYDSSSPLHTAAKQWIEKTLSGTEPIRLAWVTILAFLRITTHRKIFANPYSISEAAALVNDWLAQPCMGILQPTARHWPILTQLLQDGQATGPLVMDTHLAALAKRDLLDHAVGEYLAGEASLSELAKRTGLDVPTIMD